MTFSLVAHCAETGMFGVAIASSSPAVAARCAYTRAGVGAVASQNITDPRLGPLVLDRMESGRAAPEAVLDAMEGAEFAAYRQVLAIDAQGRVGIHSGPKALGIWTDARGRDVVSAGNLLAGGGVPQAIIQGFETSTGPFGDRLLHALQMGLAAGGEAGPIHSAGMQICDAVSWPVVDLRSDWSETPIDDLAAAWDVYRPQMGAYVQRALDPEAAPSYGVPGDE